ncbi:MAG: HPP family protein [Acidobacteria bacterium]|nr:HPP family protein [Acidobacteriota bacterium]
MRPRIPQNIEDISTQLRSPAVFVVVTGTLMVLVLGVLATLVKKPLVVPPIGPTIFILFAFPLAQEAQPRNVFCGHGLAIASGAAALLAFGLLDASPDISDLGTDRLFAVTLAMALILISLTAFRVLHIPAVATALLISLGLLRKPEDWLALMIAVLIVVAVAQVLARLRQVPMPLWSRADAPRAAELEERDFGDR